MRILNRYSVLILIESYYFSFPRSNPNVPNTLVFVGKRDERLAENLTDWIDFLKYQKAAKELNELKEWILFEKLFAIDDCLARLKNKLFTHVITTTMEEKKNEIEENLEELSFPDIPDDLD